MPEDNNELLKRLQDQVNAMEQNQQGGGDVGKILDENVSSAEQREELAKRLIASAGSEAIIAKLTEAIKHPWYGHLQPGSQNSLVDPMQAWQRPGPYEFGSGHGNRSGTGSTGQTSDYVTPKEGYGRGGGAGSSEGGGGGYTGGGGPGDSTQQQEPQQVSVTRARTPYHDTRSWPDTAGRGKTPYHSTHQGIDPGQYKVDRNDPGTPTEQISVDRARTPYHDTHIAIDNAGRGRTPFHSSHPGIAPGQYKVDVPNSGGSAVSRPPAEGAQGPYGGPSGGSPSAPVRVGGTPAITKFGVGVGGYTQEQLKGRPIQEQHAIHFEGFEGVNTKQQFDYGTGHKITGKWGAPYGTYSLNPQPLAPGGRISGFYGNYGTPKTGAFDTVYNLGQGKKDPTHTGFDPAAGRGRGSIQIHAQPGKINELNSAGCLAIPEKQFPAFREAFDKAWKQTGGQVAIEVGPKGTTIRPISGYGGTISADQALQNQKSTGSITGNPSSAPRQVDPQSASIRTKLTAQEGVMMGSGFHIGGGYFLTDSHNIKTDTKSLEVQFGKGSARAEVVHNAPNTDYALLKISDADRQKLEQHGMSSLPVSKTDPAMQSTLHVSGTPGKTEQYTSFDAKYGGISEPVTLGHGGTITSPREIGREYRVFPDDKSRLKGGEGMSGGPVTNEKGEAIGALTGIGEQQTLTSMPIRRMFDEMPEGIRKQVESATIQADMNRGQRGMMEDLNRRSGGTTGGATSGRGGGIGGRRSFEQPQESGSGGGEQQSGSGQRYPLKRWEPSKAVSAEGRGKTPLPIWAKNPGAMWPGPSASRFGSTTHYNIPDKQHNKIAMFPSHELGAAAQFDLWARKYSGMTVAEAVKKWSGHNSSAAYAKSLGIPMDRQITRQWLGSPEGLHFMIKQSRWEAGAHYPLDEAGFARAQKLAFGNGGSTESGKHEGTSGGGGGRLGGGRETGGGGGGYHTLDQGGPLPANQAAHLGLSPKDKMVWVSSPSGARFQVNEKAAGQFGGFLKDLEKTGYHVKSSGGYNYRSIRGSSRLSQHAYGSAIDIDAAHNALGSSHTNLPAGTSALARKWGLSWGREWHGRKDPMHFEVSRLLQHHDRSPETTPKEAPSHGAEEPHHYFSHTGKHEEVSTQAVQPQSFTNYYRWNKRIQQSATDHKAHQYNAAQSTPHHKQPAAPPHDTNAKNPTHTQRPQQSHAPDAARNTNRGHDWTKFHHPSSGATSRVEHTYSRPKSRDDSFSKAGQAND